MGATGAWLYRQYVRRPVERGAAVSPGPTAVRLRGSARIRPGGGARGCVARPQEQRLIGVPPRSLYKTRFPGKHATILT